MKHSTRNFIVGLTALAGVGILAYLVIIFGNSPKWVTPSYPLAIHLDDASGIASGTRVRLNGIDIGYVDKVELKDPSYLGVTIHCSIDEAHLIPTSALPMSSAGLIGGAAVLNIRTQPPPDGGEDQYLPRDGTAAIQGKTSNLGQEITEIAQRLEAELQVQLRKFGNLADEFVLVGREVRSLMESQNLSDVEAGKTAGNIRTLIAHADQRIMELKPTIEAMNKVVGEEMRAELKGVLTDARGLTQDAGEKLEVVMDRFVAVADQLQVTLDSANTLLTEARTGKGTVGLLLQDPQLYKSLTDAAQRLTDMINEVKLLVQKWKAEGLPIQL